MRYKKNYWQDSANSVAIITKQKIRINYIEKISVKIDAKKTKYDQILKSYCQVSTNSLGMITKQKLRINYIEEISIKIHAKKIKDYQTSEKLS